MDVSVRVSACERAIIVSTRGGEKEREGGGCGREMDEVKETKGDETK